MRKKSNLIVALAISSTACLVFGTACRKDKEVDGFDVSEKITVDYGTVVELENPFVTDSDGWALENWIVVTDKDGNHVYTENGRFYATDADGYIITYVVRDTDDNIYEKKTEVIVKGSAADRITIDVDYDQDVIVGEPIEIAATCSNSSAELQYSVQKRSDKTEVTVSGSSFTLSEAGAYVVTVSDSLGRATYEYMLFAQDLVKEGEVEIFDEAWEERQKLTGSKRRTWESVTSEECGILDPYGQPTHFAKFTTNKEYISLYLTMRETKEYYESLAAQGYKSVSMWIYIEGEKTHKTVADRDPLGGSFYRKDGPKLTPGKWAHHTMNLVDSAAAYNRSFVSCYDYYQNEAFRYLLADNSWDWNADGGGDTITFYIADVYATKTESIKAQKDVETQKSVTESIDFASLFTADCELEYSVTYRGNKLGIQEPSYTFKANGEYTVTAVPKLRNLRGSATVTFDVTDGQVMNSTPIIKERAGVETTVALSDLQMQFAETNGVTPTATDYKVYYNGAEVTLYEGVFKATKDGCYTVEAKGEYQVDGVDYVTYKTTTVDCWTKGNEYAFTDSSNLLYSSIYADWDADPTGSYKSYTVDGRTDTMIRSYSKGQSHSVYGKPLYSKHYYEEQLKQKPNAELVMDIYIKTTGGSQEYVRGLFTAYKTSTTVKTNAWRRFSVTLQEFIDEYDTVANTYADYKALKAKDTRPTQGNNGTGALMLFAGDDSYAREVYMQIYVSEQAETATAELKQGEVFMLGEENSLIEKLDLQLNGKTAEMLSAEIKFNGSWTKLSDGIFIPCWECEYEFRFDARSKEDGLYKKFETLLTVGEGDFTYVKDEERYTLVGEDNFDFATLTEDDYTFEYEIYTDGGYKVKYAAAETDGNLIKGSSLENGSYLVNVYAVNGDTALSRILYYTFSLDYFESEEIPVWTNELTNSNYKNVLQRYHYADANSSLSSAITVTETIPEGGVAGTYVKYAQNAKSEDIILAVKPAYAKEVYQNYATDELKHYIVVFDVYVENQDPAWAKTSLQRKVWNGASSFSSSGSVKIGQWQTIKTDLSYFLNKWGDFRTFGLNFLNNGYYDNNQRVNFYLGNIRLEEVDKEMLWADTTDASAVKLYSYGESKNANRISVTTDIPEGGVAGSYYLITQKDGVEEYRIRVKPVYEKAYYEALLKDTTKTYAVSFDIYIKRESGTQRLDEWKSATSFGRVDATVSRNTWLTRSYDLSTLVNNWNDNGVLLVGWTTATSQSPKTYAYVGNIRLIETAK